jgi:tetratricopeptide (TPR) repeat protein
MGTESRKSKTPSGRWQPSIPLLILAAFGLGAGATWLAIRGFSDAPSKPEIENFVPAQTAQPHNTFSPARPDDSGPPDVSLLAPAEGARTLANWNYDRQNWTHASEHYQEAIAKGADNPDVRTDLGSCFRFLGQYEKALEQYEIAQKENPQHENSLFNQISLFADLLHDQERAKSAARDFIARFPQSPRAESARKLMLQLQSASKTDN